MRLVLGCLAVAAVCAAAPVELSQTETELRVKTDAAQRWRVAESDVKIVESSPRTWPDAGLSCNARRGVLPESRTPGFRIIVQTGTRRLTYHTDTRGRLLRCATPGKPLDPIK